MFFLRLRYISGRRHHLQDHTFWILHFSPDLKNGATFDLLSYLVIAGQKTLILKINFQLIIDTLKLLSLKHISFQNSIILSNLSVIAVKSSGLRILFYWMYDGPRKKVTSKVKKVTLPTPTYFRLIKTQMLNVLTKMSPSADLCWLSVPNFEYCS